VFRHGMAFRGSDYRERLCGPHGNTVQEPALSQNRYPRMGTHSEPQYPSHERKLVLAADFGSYSRTVQSSGNGGGPGANFSEPQYAVHTLCIGAWIPGA